MEEVTEDLEKTTSDVAENAKKSLADIAAPNKEEGSRRRLEMALGLPG